VAEERGQIEIVQLQLPDERCGRIETACQGPSDPRLWERESRPSLSLLHLQADRPVTQGKVRDPRMYHVQRARSHEHTLAPGEPQLPPSRSGQVDLGREVGDLVEVGGAQLRLGLAGPAPAPGGPTIERDVAQSSLHALDLQSVGISSEGHPQALDGNRMWRREASCLQCSGDPIGRPRAVESGRQGEAAGPLPGWREPGREIFPAGGWGTHF
jgi:hypothetical protein